ncbi:MAG TPA: general secretion pathway protein GspK [Nitrospirae bacterium]|nr:general secretion pathway protein K [bacterium BMS3Abin06]GBE32172.1 general secretion pathway protein K [bacterium BMS3Bbin05]HDH11096.1 general secretion pathway protein GspK [Nitrospirota bacterium]HDY99929.1 general secretion pathway protein GspK [Nitrospirota bacterium]
MLNKEGSALIITLLLISILVGLVVDFVYDVYIDSSSLSNWSNAQRASLIARSGQNLSTQYLALAKESSYTYVREIEMPVPGDFGTGAFLSIKIEDENSKFNINSIIYPNGMTNEKALSSLKKLLEYLNINPNLSLVIADWIDPDKEPRLPDSEDVAKNTFLWSVDELKLIEGMMDKNIFGKISPYITVYGNNQVNINTARLPVLVCLSPDMTEALAKQIIDYRETTPFEKTSSIVNVPGFEAIGIKILNRITVKGSNFRVTAKATVNEITRMVESVMDTSMKIHFWREG